MRAERDLIGVLLNLVLDVHLATLLVQGPLARERVVHPHLVGVLAKVHLQTIDLWSGFSVSIVRRFFVREGDPRF